MTYHVIQEGSNSHLRIADLPIGWEFRHARLLGVDHA